MRPLLSLLVFVLPVWCFAESVIPIDTVEDYVNIRLMPDSSTEIVGHLDQGESVLLVSTQEGWYEVVLEGNATGFISADWTLVVDAAAVAAMRERIAREKAAEVVEEIVAAGEPAVHPVAEAEVEPEDGAETTTVIEGE